MALQPPVTIPSATATTTSGSTPISLLQNGVPARQFFIQNNSSSVDLQFSFDGTNFFTLKAGLAIGVSDALMTKFYVKTASGTAAYEVLAVSHDL
jgi:hypothetical protein